MFDKNTKHMAFLTYCVLYIFKICALWHVIFSRKNKGFALLSKRFM